MKRASRFRKNGDPTHSFTKARFLDRRMNAKISGDIQGDFFDETRIKGLAIYRFILIFFLVPVDS